MERKILESYMDNDSSKYVEENRIQAERDLQTAKIILENNGHVENVAFLLEQSYEKILKSIHAYYRLEIKNEPFVDVYNAAIGHDIDFIFRMLKDLYKLSGSYLVAMQGKMQGDKVYEGNSLAFKWLAKKITSGIDAESMMEKIIPPLQNIEEGVRNHIRNKEEFGKFLSTFNANSIPMIGQPKVAFQLLEVAKFLAGSKNEEFNRSLNVENWKTFSMYLTYILLLGPWIIPHVYMSRYPVKELQLENLEYYRNNEENIKQFLLNTIPKVQYLLDNCDAFIEQMKILKKRSN